MLLPGRHLILPLTVAAVVGVSSAGMPDADRSRQGRLQRISEYAQVAGSSGVQPSMSPAYGTYAWPVRGEVLRMYDPPETPFGSGHRGIDIAVPLGVPVRAAQAGTVAFAGPVAGALFVSIDHPDAVRTTYSWLSSVRTRAGEQVDRGAVIGLGGSGHPGIEPPHLHFGARYGGAYIDPMLLLGGGSVVGLVRLAPLEGP
jgi:murein DD-endopeptidase MepM/ murein hydrolase activator NlpD